MKKKNLSIELILFKVQTPIIELEMLATKESKKTLVKSIFQKEDLL